MLLRFSVTIIIIGICPMSVFGVCDLIDIPNGSSSLRMKGRTIAFTCDDKFVLYGEAFDRCKNGFWNKPPPRCVAPGCPSVENIKNGHVKRSHTGSVVEIICYNGMTIQGVALLTCDGQRWNSAIPKCVEPFEIERCDFESNKFCGWIQDHADDFDWTLHSGQTTTGRTGPFADHTLGPHYTTGHYIYIEASTPRKPGDKARLLSPWYPTDRGNQCFHFWYHMNGPNEMNAVGTLKVLLRTGFGKNLQEIVLFTMSGNQGENWKYGKFNIPTCTKKFQIVFEATRLHSYASDIAVDDWNMLPCNTPKLSISDPSAQSAWHMATDKGISTPQFVMLKNVKHSTRITTAHTVNRKITARSSDDNISSVTDYSITDTYYNQTSTTPKHYDLSLSTNNQGTHTSSTVMSTLLKTVDNLQSTNSNVTASTDETLSYRTSTQNTNKSSSEPVSASTHKSSETITSNTHKPSESITPSTHESSESITPSTHKSSETITSNTHKSSESITPSTHKSSELGYSYAGRNNSTVLKERASTTPKSSSKFNSFYKKFDTVFTGEAIVNMCIGLVVVCLFTVILIVLGCICRRQQKLHSAKYEELKLFVETHYRRKYITV
ncbi:zonadhesin-like [Ostrea edulis]|uniref:zonadhesin-like n=1 Tax=Ostrea edulis TaxID=37623 RepID=UPI0024AEA9D4|nr:zonadhesin-like [Ostrea edulis]